MDEILIGEKKYISSKRAAKATGYAKDYIGQLCREGRVPARLVGRSWYVLESAIHDHRFGDPQSESVESQATQPEDSSLRSTWESPRYETPSVDVLPSVNILQDKKSSMEPENSAHIEQEPAQQLQDTWQAWFARFEPTPAHSAEVQEEKVETSEQLEEDPIEPVEDVKIAVHALYEPEPQILPERIVKQTTEDKPTAAITMPPKTRGGSRLLSSVQLVGGVVAVVVALLAVLSSGYIDGYIISNSQVSAVAGVSLYIK